MNGISMMMNRAVVVSTLLAIVCQGEAQFCGSVGVDNSCAEVCMEQDPVTLMCEDNLRIQLVNGRHFGPCQEQKPSSCDGCPANDTVSECLFMSAQYPIANWQAIVASCEGNGSCNVPHTPQTVTSSDSSRCCTQTTPCSGQKSITVVTTITWTCVTEKTSTTLSTNPKPTSTTSGGATTSRPDKTTDPFESTLVVTSDLTTVDTTDETTKETTEKTTVTSTYMSDSTTDSTATAESTENSATSSVTSQAPVPTTEDTDPPGGAGNLNVAVAAAVGGTIVLVIVVACCICRKRNAAPKSTDDSTELTSPEASQDPPPDSGHPVISHYTAGDSEEQYALVNKAPGEKPSARPDLLPDTEVYYNMDPVKRSTAPPDEEGVIDDYYGVSLPADPSLIQQADRFQPTDVSPDHLDSTADIFELDIASGAATDHDYDYISHDARVLQRDGSEPPLDDNDYSVPDAPPSSQRPPSRGEGEDYDYAYGHVGTDGPIIPQNGHVVSGLQGNRSNRGGKGDPQNSDNIVKGVSKRDSLEAPVYAVSNKKKPPMDGTETVMTENDLYG